MATLDTTRQENNELKSLLSGNQLKRVPDKGVEIDEQSSRTEKEVNEVVEVNIKSYRCDECSMIFSGYISYNQHLNGRIHKRMLKARSVTEDIQRCDLCNVSFTSDSHRIAHTMGKKHNRRVKAQNEDRQSLHEMIDLGNKRRDSRVSGLINFDRVVTEDKIVCSLMQKIRKIRTRIDKLTKAENNLRNEIYRRSNLLSLCQALDGEDDQ